MRRENSIQRKVIFLALLPMLISVFVLSVFFITERINDTEESLEKKAYAIVNQLSSASDYGITTENKQVLQQLADIAMLDDDLVSVEFTKNNGSHFSFGRIHNTDNDSNSYPVTTFQGNIFRTSILIDEFVIEPRYEENTVIGKVVITVSRKDILNKQREIISNNLIFMLFFMIVTSLVAIHFANEITHPILQLTKIVNSIKHGLFDININTYARGEIAILENGIKEMASSLLEAKNREKELLQDELFIEKSRALTTLESITEAVITTDSHGHITYINPAAQKLLDSSSKNVTGKSLHKILNLRHPSSNARISYPANDCLSTGNTINHHHPLLLTDQTGNSRLVYDHCSPLYDRTGNIIGIILSLKEMQSSTEDDFTAGNRITRWLYQSQELFTRDVDFIRNSQTQHMHSLCSIEFRLPQVQHVQQFAEQLRGLIRKEDLILVLSESKIVVFLGNTRETSNAIIEKRFINHLSKDKAILISSMQFIEMDNNLLPATMYMEMFGSKPATRFTAGSKLYNLNNHHAANSTQNQPVIINRHIFLNKNNRQVTSRILLDFEHALSANIDADTYITNGAIDIYNNDNSIELIMFPVSSSTVLNNDKLKAFIYRLVASGVDMDKFCIIIESQIAGYDLQVFTQIITTIKSTGCKIAIGKFNTADTGLGVLSDNDIDYLIFDPKIIARIQSSEYMAIINAINHVAHHTKTQTMADNITDPDIQKIIETSDIDYFTIANDKKTCDS